MASTNGAWPSHSAAVMANLRSRCAHPEKNKNPLKINRLTGWPRTYGTRHDGSDNENYIVNN
jgi:hypothetical protein